ncbi:hypothetical protein AB6A40_007185 [Gnathostoma spinigerum]|uniref:Uncharacterized protein n=1 Tax=Gnathostoma spinigerum TaxID=75299 RepID=A0ABD6EMH2_9BILA
MQAIYAGRLCRLPSRGRRFYTGYFARSQPAPLKRERILYAAGILFAIVGTMLLIFGITGFFQTQTMNSWLACAGGISLFCAFAFTICALCKAPKQPHITVLPYGAVSTK